MKRTNLRIFPWVVALLLIAANLAVGQTHTARAASGAGFTSVDAAKDGGNFCLNGKLSGVTVVNCNIYTGKQYVWMNGGPVAAALGDGTYFFAVLTPGGQPNPNDGAPKNLSDTTAAPWPAGSHNADGSAIPSGDSYTNRTFTVSGGVISNSGYTGTHTFDQPNQLIRLMPYDDTTNNGGVYILAVCSLAAGYPVVSKACKYDAFKVKSTTTLSAMLSGEKYLDANQDGQLDNNESGIPNWTISITCVGCGKGGKDVVTTTTTDANGNWSFNSSFASSSGTTTYIIKEVLQTGWTETGNTTNQSMTTGSATSTLSSFVYTVTIPNDANTVVEGLNFGNVTPPPSCNLTATIAGPPTQIQITVQAPVVGLAGPPNGIVVTEANNATVNIPSYVAGTTTPVVITATKIDQSLSSQVALQVTDLNGNVTSCDPVLTKANRADGKPTTQAVTGVGHADNLVHISNSSPGVSDLTITVNGQAFTIHGLGDGEQATLDIAAALRGDTNNVSMTTAGRPGGLAVVMFGNI